MNKNVFDAKAINGEIQLLVLADLHIGNELADLEHIQAMVDYIDQTPNAYFILNGDLVENTTKNSPASVFNDTLNPIQQCAMMVDLLKPIVKKGKLINACIGNHELRSNKDNGLTPMDIIIGRLSEYDNEIDKKYMPEGAYTFIRLTNIRKKGKSERSDAVVFTLYNQHGDGGGNTYTKLSKMKDVPANVRVRSHLHTYDAHPSTMLVPNNNNYDIKEEISWNVSNGCCLRYGGYTQFKGYEPSANIYPLITLRAVRHSYDRYGKRSDYYDKEIDVVGKTKEWFLDQVRNFKRK